MVGVILGGYVGGLFMFYFGLEVMGIFIGGMIVLGVLVFGGFDYFWWEYMGLWVDSGGMMLFLLVLWSGLAMWLGVNYSQGGVWRFMVLVYLLTFLLGLCFSVSSWVMFYIVFEASLIPIFLMVVGWGYQPERLQAGMYLLFYTLFGSFPLLLILFWLSKLGGFVGYWGNMDISFVVFISLFFIIVFLVKMPMYGLHLWLPKAHVEAPVVGSMILAGVLLKLGGYGLYRVFMFVSLGKMGWGVVGICGVGVVLVGLICLRQVDISALVAYSSVAHMMMVLVGLLCGSLVGISGGFSLMVGHGLCSSGLFFMVGVMYDRLGSRSLYFSSGMLIIYPIFCGFWFMFCVMNMAAPPFMNLVGELLLLMGFLGWSFYVFVMMCCGSFFAAVFSLYLYVCYGHGWLSVEWGGLWGMSYREILCIFFHFLPVVLLVTRIEVITF